MNNYREFQFGWTLFVIIVCIQILFLVVWALGLGNHPLHTTPFIFVSCICATIELLFYGMTVSVEGALVKVSFGIGLIQKSIDLQQAENVCVVKNPWYYGWGIRMIPNGWLYNIDGLEAIEISFKDKADIIRIGSKNPVTLKTEVERRIELSFDVSTSPRPGTM